MSSIGPWTCSYTYPPNSTKSYRVLVSEATDNLSSVQRVFVNVLFDTTCTIIVSVVPRVTPSCVVVLSHLLQGAPRRGSRRLAGLDQLAEDIPPDRHSCAGRFASTDQPRKPEAGGNDGFAAREARMRAASAERWTEDELFNLKIAFDLQLKRLEVERRNKQKQQTLFRRFSLTLDIIGSQC